MGERGVWGPFVVFQIFRLDYHPSGGLVFLTVVDLVIMVMVAANPVFPSISWRRRPIRHRAGTMLAAAYGIHPAAL